MTPVEFAVSRQVASEAAIAFRTSAPTVSEDILNELEMMDDDRISIRLQDGERALEEIQRQREMVAGATDKRQNLARFEAALERQI